MIGVDTMATYKMSESAVELVKVKTAKLQKKGADILISVSDMIPVNIGTNFEPIWIDTYDVTISGILKYGQWSICASIDHLSTGNVCNVHEPIPEKYRTTASYCDHCKTVRNRNTTVIIRNENGEYKQIGKNCLAGYIGVDIENYARFLELSSFCNELSESEIADDTDVRYGRSKYLDILPYLTMTIAICNKVLYVSKATATEQNRQSTASLVDDFVNVEHAHPKAKKAILEHMQKLDINSATLKSAKETIPSIMQWITTTTDTNDYMHNLQMIYAGYDEKKPYHLILKKHYGYAVSIVSAYAKHVEKIATEKITKETSVSNYIGTVGEKIKFTGTIKYISSFDTQYGITRIYRITDTNGNIYTWFASTSVNDAENATITGTIKAHDEYKGTKQTVLTRCKVS
jgi:hypothetical protein